ncbi:MAG: hypothetical protein MHMPM18_004714, partial [Marteilia pararefringens]
INRSACILPQPETNQQVQAGPNSNCQRCSTSCNYTQSPLSPPHSKSLILHNKSKESSARFKT